MLLKESDGELLRDAVGIRVIEVRETLVDGDADSLRDRETLRESDSELETLTDFDPVSIRVTEVSVVDVDVLFE